jgi:hypothetical protein
MSESAPGPVAATESSQFETKAANLAAGKTKSPAEAGLSKLVQSWLRSAS